MNDQVNTAEKVSTRVFGRKYDFAAGTCILSSRKDPNFTKTLTFDQLPPEVQRGFGLQAYVDYVVGAGNEILRPDPKTKESGTYEEAVAEMQTAENEATEGKVEFREGFGLGGARSTINNVGRALFELGKSKLEFDGKVYEWSDLNGAKAAMGTLYKDSEKPTKEKPLSGRMLFNAIKSQPDVNAKIQSYRTTKATAAIKLS